MKGKGKGKRAHLKSLRNLLDLSQQEIADASDTTKQNISLIEYGKQAVPALRMTKINAFLRQKRAERIAQLQAQIDRLESFNIDESLFLREGEKI